MSVLYNEIDPFAAAWLRNLSGAGHIAAGKVEERSIKELLPEDVRGATQAHFFAGIGVWSYALKLAGIADTTRLWTGSCPCQPFSGSGKRKGFADDRHLWPEWFRLIRECRPPIILGEQVAAAGDWLDVVSRDMEAEGYAFGAIVLGAHSVGAPNIRQRFYFVAYANECPGRQGRALDGRRHSGSDAEPGAGLGGGGLPRLLADSSRERCDGINTLLLGGGSQPASPEATRSGEVGELGDASGEGLPERERNGRIQPEALDASERQAVERGSNPLRGFWADAEWVPCRDGKLRPVEPGTFPLAHGVASRVGRLRAYGNALNAQTAATFIRAALGCLLLLGGTAALLPVHARSGLFGLADGLPALLADAGEVGGQHLFGQHLQKRLREGLERIVREEAAQGQRDPEVGADRLLRLGVGSGALRANAHVAVRASQGPVVPLAPTLRGILPLAKLVFRHDHHVTHAARVVK